MTQQIGKTESRQQLGWLIIIFSALMLIGGTFFVVQKLIRDDCTTTTSKMPDGSEITIETCS